MKSYRKPTHTEYSIIHQLLSVVGDRNEKETLFTSDTDLEVKEMDDDGSLELKISIWNSEIATHKPERLLKAYWKFPITIMSRLYSMEEMDYCQSLRYSRGFFKNH
jgi:hypothetical protein